MAASGKMSWLQFYSSRLWKTGSCFLKFCLLLHSSSKVRPVDGSIILVIGDACCPPHSEDEEAAMEWGIVTFPSHTVNLWLLQNRDWTCGPPCASPTLSPWRWQLQFPSGQRLLALWLPQVGASWLLERCTDRCWSQYQCCSGGWRDANPALHSPQMEEAAWGWTWALGHLVGRSASGDKLGEVLA